MCRFQRLARSADPERVERQPWNPRKIASAITVTPNRIRYATNGCNPAERRYLKKNAITRQPVNALTGQPEFNGTSIIDVTDPANPKYLHHIPGLEGKYEDGGAQMVRACAGADLPKGDPSKFYMLRAVGSRGHEIYDVTDPANPVLLTKIGEGLRDTHKNFWECKTGVAFLVSGAPGWRTRRMTQIYDLSDPAKPVKIRDFGLPGQ